MLGMRSVLMILLVVLLVLAVTPPVRSIIRARFAAWRGRQPQPPANTGVTIISGNGDELDIDAERRAAQADWRGRLLSFATSRRALVLVAIVVIVVLAFPRLSGLLQSQPVDRFVVFVAPFVDPDGTVSQTGRSAAEQLAVEVAQLPGQRIVTQVIDTVPGDAGAALALVEREGADVLIWGTIAPGGMLDQESLQPVLTYRPTGVFAPAGWDGYIGRFALPSTYPLAKAPLNGHAVLPPLIGALDAYAGGKVDEAFATLGSLVETYPMLVPVLPNVVRGTMYWARGEYEQSAGEFRRAEREAADLTEIDGTLQGMGAETEALLANNLGAVLQDAHDPGAAAAFAQSIALLQGRDLGALRYNLGRDLLRAERVDEAIASLEQARNLLPSSVELQVTLSAAYRMGGHFDQAQQALDSARQQVRDERASTIADLRDLVALRLNADVGAEASLLALARLLQPGQPLLWELQASEPLPEQPLRDVYAAFGQVVDSTTQLVQGWERRSVSEDAARASINGLIASHQGERAEAVLHLNQRWQSAVAIEIDRSRNPQPPQGIAAFWASLTRSRSSLSQAQQNLDALVATQPDDIDALVLLGRARRISGDRDGAAAALNIAVERAPQRPEPLYEQAQLVASAAPPDMAQARELLMKAISFDERYAPAREFLAQIAQGENDWATVIEQQRWMVDHRPAAAHVLALAQTLRLSGRSGYAESERLLLPLASANNAQALLELGRLYRDYGDQASAQSMLERAQKVTPNDAEIAYNLGQVLAAAGDLAGAKAQYQRAIAALPAHIPAQLALAQLLKDQPSEAAQHYRAALDVGTHDPAILKQIGQMLFASGDMNSAIDAYQRAVAITPDDPAIHHDLGQAYLAGHQLDAALREEQRALELAANEYPEALVGLGDIALLRGQTQEAVQHYNQALEQNEKLVSAYIGIGRAAAADGNWSVAQAHFQNAVAHDATSAEAHLWLGEALIRQGDTNGAIAHYQQARDLKPDYAEAYFGLAQAQLDTEEVDAAAQNLNQAIALRPAYAEALLLRGKLYERLGDDTSALDAYTKSIAANGQLHEPYYRRAMIAMRQNRMSDAQGDLESATGLQANFPEGHYWLGRTYLSEGRAQMARDQLQQAIAQRSGNYAEAYFYLGRAEEQLGQRDEAATAFRTALEQDRTSPWAADAQESLTRLGASAN